MNKKIFQFRMAKKNLLDISLQYTYIPTVQPQKNVASLLLGLYVYLHF